MGKTSIEWTSFSWNPIRGTKGRHTCVRISPGCKNCYAAQMNRRGLGAEPLDYVAGADVPRLDVEALVLPLRWRKPRKVFVCSMTDLFWEAIPDAFIDRVLAVMMLSPRHTFQVLTKRAERMRDYFRAPDLYRRILAVADHELRPLRRELGSIPISNPADGAWRPWIWLGVSVEDQQRADERIPLLLQTPAAVRWVSAEPLLGPVTLNPWLLSEHGRRQIGAEPGLSWVVVGGESGHGARRCNVAWIRSVIRQCRAAKVPVFCKQLGANVIDRNDTGFDGQEPTAWPDEFEWSAAVEHDIDGTRDDYQGAPVRVHLANRKGGDPKQWPRDLRVRQMPEVRS